MGKCTWNINMLNATYGSSHRFFYGVMSVQKKAKETQRRIRNEKEKM